MADRILCGMSGGVDSSTAAGILVEQGHEVVGVTLHLSDTPASRRTGRCCAAEDVEDARRVARHLKIPHYTLDYRELFRRAVIDPFVADYAAGRTPTPCTRCNDEVKIAPLVGLARRLGLDALATGHYARIDRGGARPRLRRAADVSKDQSYFLFPATPEVLEGVRFPLGDLAKKDVRQEARRLGLPVADKAESMEVCFAPDGAASFVESRAADLPAGEIVDASGTALGRHGGIHGFTVGQRRGVPSDGGRRLYVLQIDAGSNRIVAGPEEALLRETLVAQDVRWHDAPAHGFDATVQIRHHSEAAPARVTPEGTTAHVAFRVPQRAIAPGQAAVFYDGDRVVGGGWIAAAAACLAIAIAPGCSRGSGEGSVAGTIDLPACDLDGDFDLDPDYFAAEVFDDSLTIRVGRGADLLQYSDALVLGIADVSQVAEGAPVQVVAPDPSSDSPQAPPVRASLVLARSCDDASGLTGVSGDVTFDSISTDFGDEIAARFAIRFEDVVAGEGSADLQGDFRFTLQRSSQRFP